MRKNNSYLYTYIHIYTYRCVCVLCVCHSTFYFYIWHSSFLHHNPSLVWYHFALSKAPFMEDSWKRHCPKNRCLWHVLQNYEKNSSRNWQSEGGKGWLCFWGMNLSDIHFYHPIDFKRWLHFSSTQNPIWTQVFTCSKTLGKVAVLEMHFTILWKKRNQHECWRENKQICYSKVMQMDS